MVETAETGCEIEADAAALHRVEIALAKLVARTVGKGTAAAVAALPLAIS